MKAIAIIEIPEYNIEEIIWQLNAIRLLLIIMCIGKFIKFAGEKW